MALTDFFRINLPYGIKKNDKGEWAAFNREYKPLGWNNVMKNAPKELEIYTPYNLDEKTLLKIASLSEHVEKNEFGEIIQLFFYTGNSNPTSNPEFWNQYFEKIKLLSKLVVDAHKPQHLPIAQLHRFGDIFQNDRRFGFVSGIKEDTPNSQYIVFFKRLSRSKKELCIVDFVETVVANPIETPLKISTLVDKKGNRSIHYIMSFANEHDLICFFKKTDAVI